MATLNSEAEKRADKSRNLPGSNMDLSYYFESKSTWQSYIHDWERIY